MLASTAIIPLNRLLRRESWAWKRLQACTGKVVRLHIPSLGATWLIVQDNGELAVTSSDKEPDAAIRLSRNRALSLLLHPEDADRHIRITGDRAFATELIDIARHLRWDIEQDLSTLTGDMLAHRLTKTARSLFRWHKETARNLSQTMAEYWLEEQPLLAKPPHVNQFGNHVSDLWNQTDQLEKRLQALDKQTRIDS